VERTIAEYNGISLPEEFGVDFQEVEYPKTVQDQILKDEFDLRHNFTTRAKIIVRDNKDLTIDQAKDIVKQNEDENKDYIQSEEAVKNSPEGNEEVIK